MKEHADAQFNLTEYYMNGTGTDQDFTMTLEWFEKAFKAGEKIKEVKSRLKAANEIQARLANFSGSGSLKSKTFLI